MAKAMEELLATISDVPQLVTIRDFLQDRKVLTRRSLAKLWDLTQERCARFDADLVVVRLCSYHYARSNARLPVSKIMNWLPTQAIKSALCETWDKAIVQNILRGLVRIARDLLHDFELADESQKEQLREDAESLLRLMGLGVLLGLKFPSYGYVVDDGSIGNVCVLHHLVACVVLGAKTSDAGLCVETFYESIVAGTDEYPILAQCYGMITSRLVTMLPRHQETLLEFMAQYFEQQESDSDAGSASSSDEPIPS